MIDPRALRQQSKSARCDFFHRIRVGAAGAAIIFIIFGGLQWLA